MDGRTTKLIFAACAIAWAAIVLRGVMNTKGPEDFVITVTQSEVQSFAREQLETLQIRSFADKVEYCSVIFENADGDLETTRVIAGHEASCELSYFDEPGMAPVASIHTHGTYDPRYDSERPSVLDLESDIAEGIDGYISTPGGRFWRNDRVAREAVQICGAGCLTQDPAYRPCPASAPPESFTLTELRTRRDEGAFVC